jgi:hypothetical protein
MSSARDPSYERPAITREEYQERYPRSGWASAEYWTPERREAQREIALRMMQEGRMGGQHGRSGPPRIKKAYELLAERAAKRADDMDKRLAAMLNHKDARIRLEAIREYLKAEDMAAKHRREDERDLMNLSGVELDSLVLETLAAVMGGEMVLDAEVVDEDGGQEHPELEVSVGNGQ